MTNRNRALTLIAFCSMCVSSNLNAEVLAHNSQIVQITNTSNNSDMFTIWLEGGTGTCTTGDKKIAFKSGSTSHSDVYKRAYSAALTAFTTGAKVSINSYLADSSEPCEDAIYIRLNK
ncbi:Uncharacterised protein [BD1-7 clade bacterium]|uniref:Uncharacterized protein n=1 Tax=BD1-7 clade bacterium TaxID=2029982 RepID=A0A5S9Q859_9GAMM|nr:Uncharacterised protein [BD1-7 clade bacterium]